MVQLNNVTFDRRVRPWPGNYQLKKLTINGVDVTDQVEQLDDYESMWSPCRSGTLVLIDTQNLIKNIPIIGEELVEYTVDDGLNTDTVKMSVYAISDRQFMQHGVLKYTLHLCSEEMFRDSYIRVSKSYLNKKYEDNVQDLLGSTWLDSSKKLTFGTTIQERSVVVPYWSPLHAITWMGCRSQASEPEYKGGNFMFWETRTGFKWVCTDNILDDTVNKVYATLAYDPMRPLKTGKSEYDERTPDDTLRFEEFQVVNTFNILDNARFGMYGNTTRTLDILNKDFQDTKYEYLKQFNEFKHLKGPNGTNARPLASPALDALNYPDAAYRVVIKRKNLFNNEPDGNSQVEKWLTNKIAQLQQLNNYVLEATLPGHIGLEAGMIVNFLPPDPDKISLNPTRGYDPNYSGQHLVTAVRRIYQRDKMTMKIEMVKDSRSGTGT